MFGQLTRPICGQDSRLATVKIQSDGGNTSFDLNNYVEQKGPNSDQVFINHMQSSFAWYAGCEKISGLTNYYNQMSMKAYLCNSCDALINFVPILLSKGIPIKVDSPWHSVIILGYEMPVGSYANPYDYSQMGFWISDPANNTHKNFVNINDFLLKMKMNKLADNKLWRQMPYTCYAIDKAIIPSSFQTIHYSTPGKTSKISFMESTNTIISSFWNIDSSLKKSAIEWENGDGASSKLNNQTV